MEVVHLAERAASCFCGLISHTHTHTHRHRHRQTDRQTDRHARMHAPTHTHIHIHIHTHTHTHIGGVCVLGRGKGSWKVGRGRRRPALPPLHTHIHRKGGGG